MAPIVSLVHSFASKPYLGNPAGVCILPGPREKRWMQSIAKEINFSETSFLYPAHGAYQLRWFTPTVEIDLCGHGTLASAHILWEQDRAPLHQPIRFLTKSGPLNAFNRKNLIELDFPALPAVDAAPPKEIEPALGVPPKSFARTEKHFIVELDSEKTVRRMKPDFEKLMALKTQGVIVTSLAGSGGFDFVSRCFFPKEGIPEDPVTGSAHCALGPFWRKRLKKKAFIARQASKRGGVIRLRLTGDRVRLGGEAVTVGKREI